MVKFLFLDPVAVGATTVTTWRRIADRMVMYCGFGMVLKHILTSDLGSHKYYLNTKYGFLLSISFMLEFKSWCVRLI